MWTNRVETAMALDSNDFDSDTEDETFPTFPPTDNQSQRLISRHDEQKNDIEAPESHRCSEDSHSGFGRKSRVCLAGILLLVGSVLIRMSGGQNSPDIEDSVEFLSPAAAPSSPVSAVSSVEEKKDTSVEEKKDTSIKPKSSPKDISTNESKPELPMWPGEGRKKRRHPIKIFPDFTFYVMGDVPYTPAEEILLKKQLDEISSGVKSGEDDSHFIVHVGDLLDDDTADCEESEYVKVSNILKDHSNIPILPVPGNNDWDECPHPEVAHRYFNKYYIPIEQHWAKSSDIVGSVERSEKRRENFALFKDGILFIGLHLMPKRNAVNDEILGTKRQDILKDNHEWVLEYVQRYIHKIRVVVAFGHSGDGKDVAFHKVNRMLRHYGVSLFLFQGDEHLFKIRDNFGYPGQHDWENCYRITVDQGGIAPPLKVTIRGNYLPKDEDDEFVAENKDQMVFDNILKIDRRGGVYS